MSITRNSHSFLYNHKYAITAAAMNAAATAFDHFWMASSGGYSTAWKLSYMVAVPLLRTAMWGIIGHGVDVVVAISQQAMTESTPLLQVQNRV